MLSKAERNYISGKFIPSESYKRVLDNRIRTKLKEFYMLELPLLKTNVTEFSNNQISPNQAPLVKRKWAEPDLNRRPLARKANVLTRLDDRPIHFFKVVLRCLTYEIALVNIRILFLGGCFLLNLPAKSARNI